MQITPKVACAPDRNIHIFNVSSTMKYLFKMKKKNNNNNRLYLLFNIDTRNTREPTLFKATRELHISWCNLRQTVILSEWKRWRFQHTIDNGWAKDHVWHSVATLSAAVIVVVQRRIYCLITQALVCRLVNIFIKTYFTYVKHKSQLIVRLIKCLAQQ